VLYGLLQYFSVFDGNMSNEVGLDSGTKPKVWKVYTRKRTKGIRNDDVDRNA